MLDKDPKVLQQNVWNVVKTRVSIKLPIEDARWRAVPQQPVAV